MADSEKRSSDNPGTQLDPYIEQLIDRKIAEAKLEVSEKRLHYALYLAGAFLTIFGILLPLYQTYRSADKIDSAIQRMEDRINESTRESSNKAENAMSTMEGKMSNFFEKSSVEIKSSVQEMEKSSKL